MKGIWFFLPVACVFGIVIGSWHPRTTVRSLTRQLEEARAKGSRPRGESAEGFGTFARMVNIPDEAAAKPRFASEKPLFAGAATNAPAAAAGDGEAAPSTDETPPQEEHRRRRPERLAPEDLRARIAEAQELWNTRVDIARAQWLERLGLEDEASVQIFDDAVNGMNDRLHALMQETADDVAAGRRRVDHAFGARLVSDVSGILAETYESLSAELPEEKTAEVGKMQMTDFIDPAVAEPFVQIQAQLEEGFGAEGRP